jgi:hypothetical protein
MKGNKKCKHIHDDKDIMSRPVPPVLHQCLQHRERARMAPLVLLQRSHFPWRGCTSARRHQRLTAARDEDPPAASSMARVLLLLTIHGAVHTTEDLHNELPYVVLLHWGRGQSFRYVSRREVVHFCISSLLEGKMPIRFGLSVERWNHHAQWSVGENFAVGLSLRSYLFLLLSWLFQPKSEKPKAGTNDKLFNWPLERWKVSFWRNKIKAEKLI